MTEPKYTIQGTLVKDHQDKYSYNLTSRIDAERLYHRLTTYEKQQNTDNNYEKIRQQITALQMDIKIMQDDLDKIKEALK